MQISRTLTRAGLALGIATVLWAARTGSAAVVYAINSFDANDASTSSSTTVSYDPSLVSVTIAASLTGTDGNGLFSLQNINAASNTGKTSPRFQNTDADNAQGNGTLITDVGNGSQYFQFGVSGGNGGLTLTDLTFNARNATTSAAGRGYSITASVNGGTYNPVGSGVLTAFRGSTPAFNTVTLDLTAGGYQNISSIDFRVFSTSGGVEYQDFTLNGAIPEPASAGLLGAAMTGMLLVRRRKQIG